MYLTYFWQSSHNLTQFWYITSRRFDSFDTVYVKMMSKVCLFGTFLDIHLIQVWHNVKTVSNFCMSNLYQKCVKDVLIWDRNLTYIWHMSKLCQIFVCQICIKSVSNCGPKSTHFWHNFDMYQKCVKLSIWHEFDIYQKCVKYVSNCDRGRYSI